MLSDIFPSRLLRLLGMLLVCCGIGLVIGSLPANAVVGGCRADPKVWLSHPTTTPLEQSGGASLSFDLYYAIRISGDDHLAE